MNREIKFRGFNLATNEIVSWEGMQGWTMRGLGSPNIMQYTGLKDRNGKEIFEGDIVKDQTGNNWEIYFDMGQFLLKNKIILNTPISLYQEPVIEIIGDIYSTPELLANENNNE